MSDLENPVVNLYPDRAKQPTLWSSDDDGAPTVTLRKENDLWVARFDRKAIASADSPQQLAAHLYGEYGLLAVLNATQVHA